MVIAWGKTVFGVPLGFLVSGGRVLKVFSGPEGAYGIPQSVLEWKALPGRDAVPLVLADPDVIGLLATPWPTTSGSTPGAAGASVEQVTNIVNGARDAVVAEVRRPRTLS